MNTDLYDNARWLIGAIARGLNARSGDGIAEVLERLAAQAISEADFRTPEPVTLPVLRHLPEAIGETMLLDPDLAKRVFEEALANYLDDNVSAWELDADGGYHRRQPGDAAPHSAQAALLAKICS